MEAQSRHYQYSVLFDDAPPVIGALPDWRLGNAGAIKHLGKKYPTSHTIKIKRTKHAVPSN
jgi:hypothetical protein